MLLKSNISNATFDSYDNGIYNNLFKLNGFLALTVGSLGIHVTLFWTPKCFGPYKYFLLNIAVWAFLFDIYTIFLYKPKFLLPALLHCSTGILKSSDPIVAEISFDILVSICGGLTIAVLSAFIYRYAVLYKRLRIILSWKFLAFLAFLHIFYKSPIWILYRLSGHDGAAIHRTIVQVALLSISSYKDCIFSVFQIS